MAMYGKCPKCEQVVTAMDISTIDAQTGTKRFRAATFLCPHCQTILGASLDPGDVANDLGTRVLDGVQGATQRVEKTVAEMFERLKNR